MKLVGTTSWLRPLFTLALLSAALVFIWSERSLQALFQVKDSAFFSAFTLGLVVQLTIALRWASISPLFGFKIPYRFYFSWTLAGNFASAFFPRTLEGNSLRTIWLSIPIAGSNEDEHANARRWRAETTLRWDRTLMTAALLLIGFPSLLALPTFQFPPSIAAPARTAITVLIVGSLALLITSVRSEKSRFGRNIRKAKDQTIKAGLTAFTRPWLSGFHGLLAIFIQLLRCQALWLLAQGLQIDLGGSEAIDLIVFSSLITLIPISLNGAGTREFVFAAYFHSQGWDPIDGALLGIICTGVETLVSLCGSISFFRIMNSFRVSAPVKR